MPVTKTILEYEQTRRRRNKPWWRTLFIWDSICLFMWGMTIIGSISVAVGLASFVIPIEGLALHGKRVETVVDRLLWMIVPLICAGGGLAFVVWHRRDMRRVKQSTVLCAACKQYVLPTSGECPECHAAMPEGRVATTGENSRVQDHSKKPLLLVLLVGGVLVLSSLIRPLWDRSRPGWGRRFQTTISVVDAADQSALRFSVGTVAVPDKDRWDVRSLGGAGSITLDWRYPGRPLVIEVSSEGYEDVKVELQPTSPTRMIVPLRRLDSLTPTTP